MASSVRPEPISPAMPTISPARTLKLDVVDHLAVGVDLVEDVPVLDLEQHLADLRRARRDSGRPSSRPTMSRMMRSSLIVVGLASRVETVAPSRSTVIRSATRPISFSLWVIRIEVMPWALNSSSRSSSAWLSVSFRRAVGSSRISSLHLLGQRLGDLHQLLLADADVGDEGRRASRAGRPSPAAARCARRSPASRSRRRGATSLPRKMFSAIDSSGTSASSWWMMMMPRCSLSARSRKLRTSPS